MSASADNQNGRRPTELGENLDPRVDRELTIVNEFTAVRVRKILTRNGERLEIESLRFHGSTRLDALGLEGLTWQPPEVISSFLEQPFGPEPHDPAAD